MGLESWLISGAIVWSIKMLAGRARPLLGESSRSFRPFSFISRYHSFPSGDASSAFAVASVIALRSGSVVAGMLAYSIAAMVALYRVHDDKHWFSDVFLGSVIGYAVGSKIVQLNTNRSNFGVGVGFLPLQGGSGLQISLTF
jgi:membrane-associated phospholipid phosphatase